MSDKLTILWVNDNPDTAKTMVFMYATNAKLRSWFNEVELIIWGPTSKLTARNPEIQELIKKAQDAGVTIKACLACADMFGVTDDLRLLNIDVDYMGVPLTEVLKSDGKLLTI